MKKKFVISLVFIICIIIAMKIVSNSKMIYLGPTEYTDENLNNLDNITLSANYNEKEKRINYILSNNSEEVIYFGNYVELERKLNGIWYKLEDNTGFTDELLCLQSGQEHHASYPYYAWKSIVSGDYRLLKNIWLTENSRVQYNLSVTFSINK